ncbi:MAG: ATP-binding cassette domain-containing protein [Anaerotruncus massiliensis (ex Togo et al. 2019)]
MSLEVRIRRTLRDFSLETAFTTSDGVLGILGASGCGKSMTLRCIAGWKPRRGAHRPQRTGALRLGGGDQPAAPAAAGGYLFQSYALFPHMTVEENIAQPRREEEDRKTRRDDRLAGWAVPAGRAGEAVSRAAFGRPAAAVALARILAYEPEALLLDEPFRRWTRTSRRSSSSSCSNRCAATRGRGDGDPQPTRRTASAGGCSLWSTADPFRRGTRTSSSETQAR